MNDNFEEARTNKSFDKFIYAINQNQEELINPDLVKKIDEKGNFVLLTDKTVQGKDLAMYWQSHSKTIGFIVCICSLVLLSILMNETQMLNQIFDVFANSWVVLLKMVNGV